MGEEGGAGGHRSHVGTQQSPDPGTVAWPLRPVPFGDGQHEQSDAPSSTGLRTGQAAGDDRLLSARGNLLQGTVQSPN